MADKAPKTRGAVVYTRVSTGEQARHGTSLESQREACRQKALALGLPIIAEHEDAGVSGGRLLSRAGMQAALADIRSGKADTLICANLSRYSRDVEHQQQIKREVRAAGGRLVFCDMDFDESPEGDLAFGVLGNFAAYEREVIRARSMKGNRARAAQGLQPGRVTSPYGYHVPTKVDVLHGRYALEQVGRYLVVEEEAAVVRDLFERYAAGGESLTDLGHWLDRSGVPTPGGGKFWRTTSLRYILTNPCYKGQAAFGRFEGRTDESLLTHLHPHKNRLRIDPTVRRETAPEEQVGIPCPAIVDVGQWERVNERLRENRKRLSGNPRRVFMLAGRVVCPECGTGMIVAHSGKKASPITYYQCGSDKRENYPEAAPCDTTCYPLETVEEAVTLAVEDACRNPEAVRAALVAFQERTEVPKATGARAESESPDRALEELRADELAAVQAQIAGIRQGASPDAYAEVFAALAARRKDLEDRRGQLSRRRTAAQSPTPRPSRPDMAAVLAEVSRVLRSPLLSGKEKREIVAMVIDTVMPLRGGALVRFQADVFTAGEEPVAETVQTAKTVYRKAGQDATEAAFPAGSPVAVITRGLPSGLLMGSIVSDRSADAVSEKAALKPISVVGTAVMVDADKGLLTLAPKTKPRQTIAVVDATKIKVEKADVTLREITTGMRVSARLGHQKDADGHLIATSLSAFSLLPKPLHKKTVAAKTP